MHANGRLTEWARRHAAGLIVVGRLLPAAAMLLLAGCGGDRPSLAPVTGVVLFEGKPAANVSVTFFPKRGRAANGVTDQRGRFVLTTYEHRDGALIGEHTVTLVRMLNPPLYLPSGELRPPAMDEAPPIPLRYAERATTDLAAEVARDGPNEFAFDVKP